MRSGCRRARWGTQDKDLFQIGSFATKLKVTRVDHQQRNGITEQDESDPKNNVPCHLHTYTPFSLLPSWRACRRSTGGKMMMEGGYRS
jgi:hypothetical protein